MMCVNLVSLVCDELKFWLSLKRKPIKIKYLDRKIRIKENFIQLYFFKVKYETYGNMTLFAGNKLFIYQSTRKRVTPLTKFEEKSDFSQPSVCVNLEMSLCMLLSCLPFCRIH